MKKLNGNELARRICEREGGKVNLPIAQVKEVIGCLCEDLADEEYATLGAAIMFIRATAKRRKARKAKK